MRERDDDRIVMLGRSKLSNSENMS